MVKKSTITTVVLLVIIMVNCMLYAFDFFFLPNEPQTKCHTLIELMEPQNMPSTNTKFISKVPQLPLASRQSPVAMADTSILAELSEVVPNLSTTITRFEPHNRLMVYTISTWIPRVPDAVLWVPSDNLDLSQLTQTMQPKTIGSACPRSPTSPVYFSPPSPTLDISSPFTGMASFEMDMVQQRASMLERWLRRVIALPEVRQDLNLRTFLMFQNELPQKEQESTADYEGVWLPRFHGCSQAIRRRSYRHKALALAFRELREGISEIMQETTDTTLQFLMSLPDVLAASETSHNRAMRICDVSLDTLLCETSISFEARVHAYQRLALVRQKREEVQAEARAAPPEEQSIAEAKLERMEQLVNKLDAVLTNNEHTLRLNHVVEHKRALTEYAVNQIELANEQQQALDAIRNEIANLPTKTWTAADDRELVAIWEQGAEASLEDAEADSDEQESCPRERDAEAAHPSDPRSPSAVHRQILSF
ncbi:uncharacterized protein MONBRDRAFT_27088 [Monosiga brevicollis MX1]|uniref:PX domain-containing protein n=1 Tax=Monosiga brevicollis TaxID=81824 RepID=A9V497_MONBE|nr:uncharacterized protein MONBRDRAFT_27088 [Monosiga brevicollis MX1]EDQ87580.1 predicted protein [Monosiga brevicollis MX1]|eukprot:XP_001747500.1 hypothetical protein [Monosiga brevicollis MX1]